MTRMLRKRASLRVEVGIPAKGLTVLDELLAASAQPGEDADDD